MIYLLISFQLNGRSITILSWNIKDFGKSRDDIEIEAIAELLRNADLVAIQEVVAIDPGGAKAVARLVDALDRKGSNWDYSISDPTKSPSKYISERYAFLWKSHKVQINGNEPYVGKFIFDNREIVLINYHSRTHNSTNNERIEIESISNSIIDQSFPNTIWVGDFNLNYTNSVFKTILSYGFIEAFTGEKTTLKINCKNGNYLSLAEDNIIYRLDNMFLNSKAVIDFVDDRCQEVTILRNSFSDHLPIQIVLWFN
ncbi:MAG: endonuclease/exonuclease/phosphatase family protein [Saprospiraceae bacterium]|nr:endonuclease/exonuclease/phosphatase family protein [Candidatus Defluviibacterium haderslevense]